MDIEYTKKDKMHTISVEDIYPGDGIKTSIYIQVKSTKSKEHAISILKNMMESVVETLKCELEKIDESDYI